MDFNEILRYFAYVVCIAGFSYIAIKCVPSLRRQAKQRFQVNMNLNFIKAVQIAMQHGEVNAELLERRLKVNREEARQLISVLQQNKIIGALNEHGIGKMEDVA